jgi:hypothetical protein
MSEARLTPSGHRVDDMRIVHRAHNIAASLVSDGNDAETFRRLMMLSDMLRATAMSAFNRDPETEGEAVADAFWQRRQRAIDRSRGDAD